MRTIASRRVFPGGGAQQARTFLLAHNGVGSIGGVVSTNYSIGIAEAFQTGIIYTKLTPINPALVAGPAGSWNSGGVKDPWIVKVAPGDYRMWHSGYTAGASNFQIGYATSRDGIIWTEYSANPVLTLGAGGAWDNNLIAYCSVLYEPSDVTAPFKLWYAGGNSSTPSNFQIGYAYSTDGINWTKYSGNPVVSNVNTYEAVGVSPGGVVKIGSTYNLFYNARPNTTNPSGDQVCLATFTNPQSTYTKSGSNPIIVPSTAEQALTANLTIGSASVSVGSSSGFNAGEPALLLDTTGARADVVIQSVGAGTLTLTNTVPYAWTTANGATIRSAYYGSVDGRSILPTSTGYVMYLAPFQQFAGSPFSERAAAAVSTGSMTSWSYDYTRGLVLPLGACWDTVSAENPCVIAE